ncbi:MAG TPA: PHP domain-containing protein [Syntrophales bacterium]|nr:PHP domain-containing protein [Syntrophales bacterium]HPX11045.1 PHP domain-containing protein [Syntrophales bacterium]HQB30649.1 PHP domain-containing protein [Syntrophales bacterium]HQN78497.1 PHP domain-containing protein [Syntrophales bacterium]HQQ27382.1 PHP domain-containing protein [Syntrophales bacterium]
MKEFRCDLHIHTCLSPCGDLDMYPTAIVAKAIEAGLDVIGICDHNASENAPYVIRAARGTPLTVLPGIEISSREEVHLIGIFDNLNALAPLQEMVYRSLRGTNREEKFGCQVVVNEMDEVEGFNDRLLIGSTDIPLDRIVEAIHRQGGLAIASHIDRESFGVIGQLGFVPPDLPFDALELSYRMTPERAREIFPGLSGRTLIRSSDAHFLRDIGRVWTAVAMEEPTVEAFRKAFLGMDGRSAGS